MARRPISRIPFDFRVLSPISTYTFTVREPSMRATAPWALPWWSVQGVLFAAWAPNAEVVSVVGDFNDWDDRRHPMRLRTGGIWEIFLPGVGPGTNYKYSVRAPSRGFRQQKADPYG